MDNSSRRVISISLSEQEWQALVRLYPQPQVWLREKIHESLNASGVIVAPSSAAGAANTTSATTR
jgi:hypothetical protein